MNRTCKTCEYRVDVQRGEGIYPECSNTKRKQNGISLKISTSPSWCAFKRVNRRKRKKSPRALLVKELDNLWSVLVKLKANNKCEMCGKLNGQGRGQALNAHHIFGRSNYSVRWDEENGVCLTAGNHTLTIHSAHKAPAEFIEFMKKKRGIKWYNDLRVKANMIKKWAIPELQEKKKELTKEIKKEENRYG